MAKAKKTANITNVKTLTAALCDSMNSVINDATYSPDDAKSLCNLSSRVITAQNASVRYNMLLGKKPKNPFLANA